MKRFIQLCALAVLSVSGTANALPSSNFDASSPQTPMLAQAGKQPKAAKKAANNKGGGRERFITREKTMKGKDQTNVDFDSIDISGATRTPMGSLVTTNGPKNDYDLIKIRLRWHPEMVQSASTLESGKGQTN